MLAHTLQERVDSLSFEQSDQFILFTLLKLTGQCWEEREVYDVLFSVQNVSWLVRINHVKGVVSLNTVSEGPVGFVDNAAFAFGPMGCSHI